MQNGPGGTETIRTGNRNGANAEIAIEIRVWSSFVVFFLGGLGSAVGAMRLRYN